MRDIEVQAVIWCIREHPDPGAVALGVAHDLEVGRLRLQRSDATETGEKALPCGKGPLAHLLCGPQAPCNNQEDS